MKTFSLHIWLHKHTSTKLILLFILGEETRQLFKEVHHQEDVISNHCITILVFPIQYQMLWKLLSMSTRSLTLIDAIQEVGLIYNKAVLRFIFVAFIGSWSASTSPARSPSPPTGGRHYNNPRPSRSSNRNNYGTTSLCQRSRSPSPTHTVPHQHGPPSIGKHNGVKNPILDTYIPFL